MKTRTALLAVLAAALACADNRASIQIQAICYPTAACGAKGGCEKVLTGVPSLASDTTNGAALVLELQVENQLPQNGDSKLGRVNTNDAHIDEIAIEYDGAPIAPVTIDTSSWIPAATTATALVFIPVPPTSPDAYITARLRLRGYLDDSSRFETGEFPIAFAYCASCGAACTTAKTCPPGAGAQDPVVCIPDVAPTPVP
jgi:hypothetical protein